jgi:type IX secretion system PorP/SprF family membrane protein
MRLLALLTFLEIVVAGNAQQLPQFTQFGNNVSLVNAANFVNENSAINIGARSQMLGFGSEPNTAFVYGHYLLKKKSKPSYNPQIRISKPIPVDSAEQQILRQAIGGCLMTDRYGAFGRIQVAGFYNLGLNLSYNWKINGAIKLGYSSLGFNQEKAVPLNVNDPFAAYLGGDNEYDAYTSGNGNAGNIDLGAALIVQNESFKIGVALDQLTGDNLGFSQGPINFNQKLHTAVFMGYAYEIEDLIKIEALILGKKMAPTPLSFDASLKTSFPNGLWAGVNYRHNSSVGIMGGFSLNQRFRMGYSFDIITTRLQSFSNGGHELILGYAF